jgi:hypothetical protein
MWLTLINKIQEKLKAHTGEGEPLVEVFPSHKTKFSGYPSATFEPSEKDEDFRTNVENGAEYTFEIVIHQEVENTGLENAIRILASVISDIEADFREDYLLGGTVRLVRPVGSQWGEYAESVGWVKYATLKLIIEVDV